MIKIVIADDHHLLREGLKNIIQKSMDMKIVGEAANWNELMPILENDLPDILILDITMPGRNGLEILKEIKEKYTALPVLILSIHPEERFAVRAFQSGAWGYLTKSAIPEELMNAIRKIAIEKRKYISSSVAEELVSKITRSNTEPLHDSLSNREFQIMRMIANGKTVSDISKELSLSPQTIHTYRTRIKEKMGLSSDVEITHYAINNNLI